MEVKAPERKWALMKLDKGDWLLPSNDRKATWRLRREDVGMVDWADDGSPAEPRMGWHLYKCLVNPADLPDRFFNAWGDPDWDIWEGYGAFDSRVQAIVEAMRYET